MARRRRPLSELERRERAELLAWSLPSDRDEWERIVGQEFGAEAAKFAAAVFPDRCGLEFVLGSDAMLPAVEDVVRGRPGALLDARPLLGRGQNEQPPLGACPPGGAVAGPSHHSGVARG